MDLGNGPMVILGPSPSGLQENLTTTMTSALRWGSLPMPEISGMIRTVGDQESLFVRNKDRMKKRTQKKNIPCSLLGEMSTILAQVLQLKYGVQRMEHNVPWFLICQKKGFMAP